MPDDDRPPQSQAVIAAIAGLLVAGLAFAVRTRTVIPPGFFDGLAALAFTWGLSPAAARHLWPAWGPAVRGVGAAAWSGLFLSALVPPFDRAAAPVAAWALAAGMLHASLRARRAPIVPAAVGVLLLALGAVAAWFAAGAWPDAARLRATTVAGTTLAILGLAARVALTRRHPKLAPSPAGIVLVSALAVAYVGYRPVVAAQVGNLPLYEWTLGVAVALLLLGRVRRSARDNAVNEAWSGDARRHAPDAAPAYDPRMAPLAAAIARYLSTGQGFDEYRAAMMRASTNAPTSFRKALQGAQPVQGSGRAAKAARARRLAAHNDLMEQLHGHAPPALRTHP